jgi:hypothetical protein
MRWPRTLKIVAMLTSSGNRVRVEGGRVEGGRVGCPALAVDRLVDMPDVPVGTVGTTVSVVAVCSGAMKQPVNVAVVWRGKTFDRAKIPAASGRESE